MSHIVIDIDFFLNEIGRSYICELSITYHKKYLKVIVMHYHNKPNIDKYIVQTENTVSTTQKPYENENPTTITSLYGLINMTRLKIVNIPNLTELPYIGDCIKLKKLLCYGNCLEYLPIPLPSNIDYIDCGKNKLKELPRKLPSSLRHLYCDNNQLQYLPILPITLQFSSISNNPFYEYLGSQYNRIFIKKNNILRQFRLNYYSLKYGWRIFFYILRRRMSKYKKELLEMSARVIMNPNRIMRLLELYDDLEDII